MLQKKKKKKYQKTTVVSCIILHIRKPTWSNFDRNLIKCKINTNA